MKEHEKHFSGLITLVTVFFFWGFIAASNSVLIPFCKKMFTLSQFQAQLIDTAFYGSYYFGALFLFLYSSNKKIDIINKWGYKTSIIYGLLISVIGSLIMMSIGYIESYTLMLISLFVIGLGFCLQQTSANPFAILLGPPETGSHRLNLAGGINSLGTTIGPVVISLVLFGSFNDSNIDWNLNNINTLYVFMVIFFLLAALLLKYSNNLPNVKNISTVESSPNAIRLLLTLTITIIGFSILTFSKTIQKDILLSSILIISFLFFTFWIISRPLFIKNKKVKDWGAMKYPQLTLGMLAIFTYVGVEVTIVSNLGALLQTSDFGSINTSKISGFIAMYWGSLMIGRWLGAITVFKPNKLLKNILFFTVPYIAFMIILGCINLKGDGLEYMMNKGFNPLFFGGCILIQIIGFLLAKEKPVKTLFVFSVLAIIAMIIGLTNTGMIATYAFLSGGLFCSIMWPCIFSLSIAGLKEYTSQGSSFLIMMILGGAIIPPIQGYIADTWNIHSSYIITVFCFLFIAFFALKAKSILKKQGIDYEDKFE